MKKIFTHILFLACCLTLTTCKPEFTMDDVFFTVEAQPNDATLGSVTGSGKYHYKDEITLKATPTTNYEFIEWSDGNTDNPRKIVVSCDTNYIAMFCIPTENGHEYVDLGLPSGTLWATCNVGATSLEDYGDYFAWGETRPKSTYNWSTYKYCKGSSTTLTKYCTDTKYGVADGKITLEPEDDAATANWGGRWRMPTSIEQDELLNECALTRSLVNGVTLHCLTGPNGNYLYLPAAGYRHNSDCSYSGNTGFFWANDINNYSLNNYMYYWFNSEQLDWGNLYRSYGFSVRPVIGKTLGANTYTISVTANDATKGTVAGAGTYAAGTTATLTATPANNCQFVDWNDGVKDNPRKITVTQDMRLTANFEFIQYTINTGVNDETMGSVTGGGTYNSGSSATLQAIPNENYYFVNWNDKNTDNPRTIFVAQDMNLIANFALLQYTISLSINNETMGSVIGGGIYRPGTSVTLYATPNEGYRFVKWSDDNTDNPRTIIVSEDIELTAYFGLPAINGYEYIDLGLPSGTLWATCNIGASSPEDYGDRFAWSETESKPYYDGEPYQWGVVLTYDKYNNTDGKTILEAGDDAATANWGSKWRMPTQEEQQELLNNCTWAWTSDYNGTDVAGYIVSRNTKSIFLPAAGYSGRISSGNSGKMGLYWSSSLDKNSTADAYYIIFNDDGYKRCQSGERCDVGSVRPVCSPQ